MSAFEPSDAELEKLTGRKQTNESGEKLFGEPDSITGVKSPKKGGSPSKSKDKEVIKLDSDDDLPSLPTLRDIKPKSEKLKSEDIEDDKENIRPARKNGKGRAVIHDSDSEPESDAPVASRRASRKRKAVDKPKSKKSNSRFTDFDSEDVRSALC